MFFIFVIRFALPTASKTPCMESLKSLLFIDIETASGKARLEALSEGMQREWDHKARQRWSEEAEQNPGAVYYQQAATLAEFGRIVCISIGWVLEGQEPMQLFVKSFYGEDEKALLDAFCHTIGAFADKRGEPVLVGHNIREFDIPFIARRMILHGMSLPGCLKLQDKKPWEILHQDTLHLWRFGDRAFVKLTLLCELFGVPTPKDDISGADVTRVFWEEKDMNRIARYCEKDVLATARVYFHLQGMHEEAKSLWVKEGATV